MLLLLSECFLSRFPGWHVMSPPASLVTPRGLERLTVSCAQSAVLVQYSALQEVQHREIIRRADNVYSALGSTGPQEHPTLTNRQALTTLFIDTISPLPHSPHPPTHPPPILKRFPSHALNLMLQICVAVVPQFSIYWSLCANLCCCCATV